MACKKDQCRLQRNEETQTNTIVRKTMQAQSAAKQSQTPANGKYDGPGRFYAKIILFKNKLINKSTTKN